MKYLNSVPLFYKKFSNIILASVTLRVRLVVVSTGTKVSVVLLFLLTLNMSEYLKKILIGGFSCLNTRLTFDTEILIDDNKNEKVLFDIYIDGKKQTKRISSNILKMDENNQYEVAVKNPLSYSCILKKDIILPLFYNLIEF